MLLLSSTIDVSCRHVQSHCTSLYQRHDLVSLLFLLHLWRAQTNTNTSKERKRCAGFAKRTLLFELGVLRFLSSEGGFRLQMLYMSMERVWELGK